MNLKNRCRKVGQKRNRVSKFLLNCGVVLLCWHAFAQQATTVTNIAAGGQFSLFIQSDGSLWGMGRNNSGQLGNGVGSSLRPELIAGGAGLRATCGFGATYYLLASTNVALPLNQWSPVWTNTIVLRGGNNFSAPLTNAASPGSGQFYIIKSQ